jgi:peptide/nickel transport system permease protein
MSRAGLPAALGRRLVLVAVTVAGVLTLVFLFLHLLPGDPVEAMLGENAAPVDRERLRRALGLDRPVWEQYLRYVGGCLRGDLGTSLHAGRPVAELVLSRVPATVGLAAAAAALAAAIALPLGVLAAARPGTWIDAGATGFALLGASLPNFFLGPLLVLVFSIRLGWLPVSGAEGARSVLLPALTLGLGMSAILARLTRSALLEVLGAEFVRVARAKGLPERAVFVRHALRNALLGVTTIFGLQLGTLLGGAIVTETIFAWPGIGRLTLQAIQSRDYPVVQGCLLVIALGYVLANLATDLACRVLDPRLRGGEDAA